jgi:hypothetical protein
VTLLVWNYVINPCEEDPGLMSRNVFGYVMPGHRHNGSFGTHGSGEVRVSVALPSRLASLADVHVEVELDISGAVTQRTVLDALKARQRTGHRAVPDHRRDGQGSANPAATITGWVKVR